MDIRTDAASVQARALWLSCLLPLAAFAAPADEPDLQTMRAQTAAMEVFAIERARAALADGDVRAAMVMAWKHDGRRRQQIAADYPDAAARRATLDQLALEAIALAIARGADDSVVQLMLSRVCDYAWASCDADAAVARLAELEPGNGVAAMVAVSRAHDRKQTEDERAAMVALAGAERLDEHGVALLAAARDFVGDAEVPAAMLGEAPEGLTAEDQRAMLAFGIWLAIPRYGYQALSERCRATQPDSNDHLDCIRALRVVSNSDSLASRAVGLALLEALVDDPGERARIRAQRRDLDWQISAFGELTRQVGEVPGSAAAHLDAMIAAGGEAALLTKRLSDAGISMSAPADYEPSNPALRD